MVKEKVVEVNTVEVKEEVCSLIRKLSWRLWRSRRFSG